MVAKIAEWSVYGFFNGFVQSMDGVTSEVMDFEGQILCGMCSGVMQPVEEMIRGNSWKRFAEGVVDYSFCEIFGFFYDDQMCYGLMNIWADFFWEPVSRGIVSKDRVCAETIGWCRTPKIR